MQKVNLAINKDTIPLGSRWRENDPRHDRIVQVVNYLEDRLKVGIATVQEDGSLAERITWAKVERFNSTARGKYSRVGRRCRPKDPMGNEVPTLSL